MIDWDRIANEVELSGGFEGYSDDLLESEEAEEYYFASRDYPREDHEAYDYPSEDICTRLYNYLTCLETMTDELMNTDENDPDYIQKKKDVESFRAFYFRELEAVKKSYPRFRGLGIY